MNRRQLMHRLLTSVCLSPAAASTAAGQAAQGAKGRLLGRWRSDRERTLRSWSHLSSSTEAARARIEGWFGKFEYSFSLTTVRAEYEGGSWDARYRVAAQTDSSVTLLLLHAERTEDLTLYFDEPYFFLRSGRYNFEYFRRVAA